MSIQELERAAATAAWISAALRGACGVEHVLDVIRALDDSEVSPVFRANDKGDALSLPFAIAHWRRQGVAGWVYLPVAPGDASGLPGPSAFTTAALDGGVGLLAAGGQRLGMVPDSESDTKPVWREFVVEPLSQLSVTSPADAERVLLDEINASVDLLERLDLAHWNAGATELRDDWVDPTPMPQGTGQRAERLAFRSRRILQVVEAAMVDDGGSRTLTEMELRRSSLGGLARAARSAHATAWNTGLRSARERR